MKTGSRALLIKRPLVLSNRDNSKPTMKIKAAVVLLVVLFAGVLRAEEPRIEGAEIKFVVKGGKEEIERALRAAGLDEGDGKPQRIFFYDTADKQLYAKGLVLRARLKHKSDATVKYRASAPLDVAEWKEDPDFKSELDYIGAGSVLSHSLKRKTAGEELNGGAGEAKRLFDASQQKFAAHCFKGELPWDKLRLCGPIPATAWEKIKLPGFDRELDAERWASPEGPPILEFSTKVENATESELQQIRKALQKSLEAKGIEVNEDAESKTASALTRCFGQKNQSEAATTPR